MAADRRPTGGLSPSEGSVDDWMRQKIEKARSDTRPSVPAEKVLERLRVRMNAAAGRSPQA